MGLGGFFDRLLAVFLIPLFLVAISPAIGFGVVACSSNSRKSNICSCAAQVALQFSLLVLFFSYPTICSTAFTAFDCRTFSESGSPEYLVEDYAVECG